MPSNKPRIALTVSPELQVALFNLSEAVGRPVATLVVELLEDMIPQLEGLAKIARAAKSGNKAAAKRALQHMLGDSLAEVAAGQQPELFGKQKARK